MKRGKWVSRKSITPCYYHKLDYPWPVYGAMAYYNEQKPTLYESTKNQWQEPDGYITRGKELQGQFGMSNT